MGCLIDLQQQHKHSVHPVGADVDDDVFFVSPFHCFFNLLQKNLWDSSAQSMHSFQKLQLKRVIHGLKEIVLKRKLKDNFFKNKENVLGTEVPFKMQKTSLRKETRHYFRRAHACTQRTGPQRLGGGRILFNPE